MIPGMPTGIFQPISEDKIREHIQAQLSEAGKGANVSSKRLAGGVISFIYEATSDDGKPLVVKYTEDRTNDKPPFNKRADHFISREGHNVDAKILKFLKEEEEPEIFTVPQVLHHLPDSFITVMPDLRAEPHEMTLFSTDLSYGIGKNGFAMGFAIAHAQFKVQQLTGEVIPTETPEDQFGERGEGLLQNDRRQIHYRRFLELHCQEDNPLILTDLHPKNIFLGLQKEIGFIDFGRTTTGDPDFVLPNFCSHIILNVIIGNIPRTEGINYIRQAVNGYRAAMSKLVQTSNFDFIDEEKFVFFTAAEILNRHKGKFVDYFDNMNLETKIACQNSLNTFANLLLGGEYDSIESMLSLATLISIDVSIGTYTHKKPTSP